MMKLKLIHLTPLAACTLAVGGLLCLGLSGCGGQKSLPQQVNPPEPLSAKALFSKQLPEKPLPTLTSLTSTSPETQSHRSIERLKVALTQLLSHKINSQTKAPSEIPEGTKVLDIKQTGNPNQKAYRINLNEAFTSGGGSYSMQKRLEELTQTVASLKLEAPVYLDIEGKELRLLGGEGLEVEEPLKPYHPSKEEVAKPG